MNRKPIIKIKSSIAYSEVVELLKEYSLNTVCTAASCPNQVECFSNKTATFLILGNKCTRNCTFCDVSKDIPDSVNPSEPENISKAVSRMKLKHVVITSVTRDDLEDGGSGHFAETIKMIKKNNNTTVEVLIPDFKGSEANLMTVLNSGPDIINHNMETVKRLYPLIRPEADYNTSLEVLRKAKDSNKKIFTKSGIMLGLGETEEEIKKVITDIKNQNCDFLTIGQYLQPSKNNYPVISYITENKFIEYKKFAYSLGFKFVASSPLVRSSYKAAEAIKDQ